LSVSCSGLPPLNGKSFGPVLNSDAGDAVAKDRAGASRWLGNYCDQGKGTRLLTPFDTRAWFLLR
jgi:hypothetical protein